MSEIEKLYENAGIEVPIVRLKIFQNDNGKIYTQPPFTAGKQLELIKWLIQEVDNLQLWHFGGKEETFDFDLGKINAKGATFEETLAKLLNSLWQDLTDVEKEQIRDILKG